MSENTRTHQLIGRISALVLLLLAAAYGIGGSMIEYAFSSDPLGPRFVPVMLAILLGLFTLIYLKFPGSTEGFPTGKSLVRVLAVPVTLIVSVALMEPLGFAACILLMTTVTGWIFGASPKLSLIGGVVHAALWWFIFSFLLEVYLPTGAIFG
jgi:putative tricarboxylic transport membrane protein